MKSSHKLIIVLSITLVVGFTWSLDMPLALQVPLRQEPFSFSNFEFSFLYFATYIAICFCDIPIGMLLDKLPLRKTVIWVTSISLISQVGIMLMFHYQSNGYKIALYILRAFFGISGSGLFTIQAILITRYGGKYYDTLIGVGVCIPFFFDSLNNVITPLIYDSTTSMDIVWSIGIGFCLIASISAFMISQMTHKQEKQSLQLLNPQNTQKQQQKSQQLNFNGLKTMCKQFWILIGAIFFTQLCIASYIDNLNDTLVKRFQIPYVTAGYFLFIPYGLAALFSFILGRILQKSPKIKRKIILFATICFSIGMAVAFALPNISSSQQSPPMFYYFVIAIHFLTISFIMSILYGCLSSSIKYVVQQKNLGIAWGVIGSTVGLSQALGPIIAALVLQTGETLSQGYKNLTLCVFFISIFAISFSLWIYIGEFGKIDVNSSEYIVDSLLEDSLVQGLNQKLHSNSTIESIN